MEYPWQHHHPPPPLYPPPLQPPPPPPPPPPHPQQYPNPSPIPQSHNYYPTSQLHHHYPISQSHIQNLNPQSHFPNPTFQLHDPNPSSQPRVQNPNFRSHDQPPSFELLRDQHPIFRLHDRNPSFLSQDQRPSFEMSHDQHPSFHSHDRNPSLRLHDQDPNFQSHNQNPSFDFLHDQHPGFRLHDRKPSLRPHDQNPSFQSYNQDPRFELLRDQHPSFRLHDRNPSFELSHDQHPGFQSHGQDPRLNLLDKNPSFRSQSPQVANDRNPGDTYSPFDHGYKRPRPDELGINERRLKLIHDHGSKDPMLPNTEIRGDFREDLGLKRPRFEESGIKKNHYKVNEFKDTDFNANELNQRGYGKRPSLEANFRSNFEHKQGWNDLFPPNHDIRPNGFNGLRPTLQVSPQNRTISENRSDFMDPKGPLFSNKFAPSLQEKPSSLFPISVTAAAPSYFPLSEVEKSSQPCFQDKSRIRASNGFPAEEFQPIGHRLSTDYSRERRHFPLIPSSKPKALDSSRIFKQPHRATRPDNIVVILRGLPGSGKSYLAKMMRDLEVENGGTAPRIHSMDDYFMTEVEKVEESDNLKSSGASRGKKPVVKMVMEYCYEAEMEEAYRSSMLKTFKKTLDEGAFPFVIVDDRNLRVADFAQFWVMAKRSGYEVYLLEATYKDPAGCAARNVHNFTLEDIQKMADLWEEAPSMYLKLDAKSLLQGDDLKENTIQEVDMDTDDGESEDAQNGLAKRYSNTSAPAVENLLPSGQSKAVDNLNSESDHLREEVKELGRSKWSNDLEDDNGKKAEFNKGDNAKALSAIVKVYKKEGKSVHWGDKAANTGFSIGAAKTVNTTLEIGPGSGYNSKSNPLLEELGSSVNHGKSKTQSVFQERIRAERESTQAVFDRRRYRIGGFDSDEE